MFSRFNFTAFKQITIKSDKAKTEAHIMSNLNMLCLQLQQCCKESTGPHVMLNETHLWIYLC